MVKLLLAHPDIDVNIQDTKGSTPLHRACQSNYIEIAKLLLSRPEIDINSQDKDGENALTIVTKYDINININLVKLLLTHPKIEMNLNYKNYKYLKLRNLLKSHTNFYKNSVNKILDEIDS